MRRAGGYRGYWAAYDRLLLEDSRPLDATSANRFPPGVHDVEVEEVEVSHAHMYVRLVGRARREIRHRVLGTHRLHDLLVALNCDAPIEWGKLKRLTKYILGQKLRARIEERGDVDLRVCAGGEIVAVRGDDAPQIFDSLEAAEEWLEKKGFTRRRPTVVEFLPPRE